MKQISREEILISVKKRLERQRILEKEGYTGLLIREREILDEMLNSVTSKRPTYVMSDSCSNILNYFNGKVCQD